MDTDRDSLSRRGYHGGGGIIISSCVVGLLILALLGWFIWHRWSKKKQEEQAHQQGQGHSSHIEAGKESGTWFGRGISALRYKWNGGQSDSEEARREYMPTMGETNSGFGEWGTNSQWGSSSQENGFVVPSSSGQVPLPYPQGNGFAMPSSSSGNVSYPSPYQSSNSNNI